MIGKKQLPLLAALLFFGCQSEDFYRHQAVERARKYLLEEVRTFTPEQEAFIRNNYPVMLHAPVTDSQGGMISSETRQICISWRIPGEKTDYMVFGLSEPRMQFWRPIRLIRRPRSMKNSAPDALRQGAVDAVITNLQSRLSVDELNRVRFTYPKTVLLKLSVTGKEKLPQLALLWPIRSGNSYVAVLGEGRKNMSSWNITSTGIFSAAELDKATVRVLNDPAEKTEKK